MSRLEELINELCPDGVLYSNLQKICDIESGKLNSNEAVDDGEFAFFTTAKLPSKIDRFRWNTTAILVAGNANVGHVQFYEGKFEAYQRTYVLTNFISLVNPKFLFYVLGNSLKTYLSSRTNDAAMTYIVLATLQNFEIPVPPLPVQEEIVRILDSFTELTTELIKEYKIRLLLDEQIKIRLLTKTNFSSFVKISDLFVIEKGKTAIQKNIPGDYPLVATTEHLQSSINYQIDGEAICIPLISARGHGVASISRIYYMTGKFALGNILCALIPKTEDIDVELTRHYLFYNKDVLLVPLMRGGANVSLTIESLKEVKIPVFYKGEYISTKKILVTSEEILNVSNGLPAEIELRQKQYEYYRDKLLTFKRKD